ncbi:MAG: PhzF family phenazine biosynthesis protein [Gammaproteobacteria bacterium]
MRLKIYQVDAFSAYVFSGNPAAVIPLKHWLDDATMQAIAAENNLAETAFFIAKDDHYHLRWFTPTQEVPLCGYATLASALIVFTKLAMSRQAVKFETLSGMLEVRRSANGDLTMVLPKLEPLSCNTPANLVEGLGLAPTEVLLTEVDTNYYAIYNNENEVRSIMPDLMMLEKLHPFGVVVTAEGEEVDFVSRYFAPGYGIPEDPVTVSIHCALIAFWSKKLGKQKMLARQISKRGGELACEELQDQVLVSGHATIYLEGEITV